MFLALFGVFIGKYFTKIYPIFNKDLKLTEDKARRVVFFMEDANERDIVKAMERKIEHLATKEDLAKLEIRI